LFFIGVLKATLITLCFILTDELQINILKFSGVQGGGGGGRPPGLEKFRSNFAQRSWGIKNISIQWNISGQAQVVQNS